nr:hypothetical protein [Tanacetum cinerariifolium]
MQMIHENFNAPSTESLDSIFNRLQKTVSQLANLGENISQEDLNMKFLRSLPFVWNTHVVVWRNKADLDTMSIDNLYNNFKIIKQEVKRTVTTSSSLGSQNMAFLLSSGSTNEVDNANIQVSTVSTPISVVSTHDNTANLSDAIVGNRFEVAVNFAEHENKNVLLENWECGSPRNQESRPRNQDSSRKTVKVEDTSSKAMVAIDRAGFDWSYMADDEAPTNMALMAFSDSETKVECFNCHKMRHFARESRSPRNQESRPRNQDSSRKTVKVEDTSSKAMVAIDRAGSQISDNSKTGLGFASYNDVAPPPIGLFAPPTIDLSNSGLEEFQYPEFKGYGPKDSKSVCVDTSNEIKKAPDDPIIEDWVSDSDEDESEVMILKSDNVQHKPEQANQPRKVSQNPKKNITNWNEMRTQKLGVRKQEINAVKSSACWVWIPKIKVQDHVSKNSGSYICKRFDYVDLEGRLKHMARNISYLTDFKEHDGGYVAEYIAAFQLLWTADLSKNNTLTGSVPDRVEFRDGGFQPERLTQLHIICLARIHISTTRAKEKQVKRVLDLEKIKTAQAKKITNLKKKVKKLERKRRFKTLGMNYYELAAKLKAEEQRRKPLTKAQKRNQI